MFAMATAHGTRTDSIILGALFVILLGSLVLTCREAYSQDSKEAPTGETVLKIEELRVTPIDEHSARVSGKILECKYQAEMWHMGTEAVTRRENVVGAGTME